MISHGNINLRTGILNLPSHNMSKHKNQFMDKYRCVFDPHKKKLGDNDTLFLDRVFAGGIGPYESRLKSLGFIGKAHVLDAGCGFGQWSLALSALNKQISACDISPLRIDFLREIISEANISNIAPLCSGIDKLPYSDNSFDVVFCYGVIFLTPWRKSLAELARVLKKNGVLYVNANGLGWYLFLLQEEHNKAKDYDPKSLAAKAFSDTLE